jgi:DNA gyrase/topoisomerase IV subunit B
LIADVPYRISHSNRSRVACRYEKKTQVEHVLLRPDVYVGSMKKTTRSMMVFNEKTRKMELRDIQYIPGLLKIFDEILVNAADNKHRDPNTSEIEVLRRLPLHPTSQGLASNRQVEHLPPNR